MSNMDSGTSYSAVKYCIVDNSDMASLAQLVNTRIAEGWVPIGGVCAVTSDFDWSGAWYYQAMTLADDRKGI